MRPRLLLVEDDTSVRRSLAETLSDEGFEVAEAESAPAAVQLLADFEPEIVLSDVRMPEMDGFELLRLLRERAPSVDVILMTAYDDMATVARAMREGAFDFLVKPLKLDELRSVLGRLLDDRRSREQAKCAVETEAQAHRLDADSIDLIAEYGVTAVVQPGGSVRDKKVIAACNEHGIAMVFTDERCFRHF